MFVLYVFIGEVSPEEERPAKRAKMGSTSTTTSTTAGKFFYVLHLTWTYPLIANQNILSYLVVIGLKESLFALFETLSSNMMLLVTLSNFQLYSLKRLATVVLT